MHTGDCAQQVKHRYYDTQDQCKMFFDHETADRKKVTNIRLKVRINYNNFLSFGIIWHEFGFTERGGMPRLLYIGTEALKPYDVIFPGVICVNGKDM
jgi:hypothetical protein